MKVAVLNLLLLVLQAGVYNAAPSTYTQVLKSSSRRPAEFDAFLERHKRESSGQCPTNSWHHDRSNCPSVETSMRFDALQRRQSGLLSTVESQGRCGSCWAFASSSTFTDCRSIAAGQMTPPLSPQYLTTCIRNASYVGNGNGCCGGYIEYAAFYLMSVGTTTSVCLPYNLSTYFPTLLRLHFLRRVYKYFKPLTCSNTCSSGMDYDPGSYRLAGYRMLKTEEDILAAINRTGPVVATMDASLVFKSYECGVFCLDGMGTPTPNHAVEIVDYGRTNTGIDFYVVKNSWGKDWGEGGYFRIRRGDLGVGLNVIQLVISPSGAPQQNLNFILPPTSRRTCSAEVMPSSNTDEVVIMVANFTIEELNERELIRCPDNITIAGPITLSSIVNATYQTVAGTYFNVTMKAQVGGCGAAIHARISAMVFVDLDGNFNLTSYTYSSGAGIYASIILLLVTAVLNFLLIACY